ncbi:hypothetical protein [Neorhizobium sp. SOG26]|uniref:hypothetical protein n=1 Tax=Neorhizobium sp. SOG26 TaxID=2060726 RepID=UPI0012376134|nr:hypothetical protein [Neorhizobium sp. SOG26]
MIHITPMTTSSPELEERRVDLGTFKKQLIEANGAVFDGMTGLLVLLIMLAIGIQAWGQLQ